MNYKLVASIVLGVVYLFNILLCYLNYASSKNKLPDNVKDIYNEEEFEKWKKYNKENSILSFISTTVSYAICFILLLSNVLVKADGLFEGEVGKALGVVSLCILIPLPFEIVFSYYSQMVIEEKYGFNKTTIKTFIFDVIKEFILNMLLSCLLVFIYILLINKLGAKMVLVFALVLYASVLTISFLYPYIAKIDNKFTPLEDGPLKDNLTALLVNHGYHIKEIKVMDASKRTTKSNAYFAGFGKTKTIVLYDNILNALSPNEICAVFAHELGHGLHKDTLKNSLASLLNILIIAFLMYGITTNYSIYEAFGFSSINYGFGYFLLSEVALGVISPIISLFVNLMSRTAEYKADKQAVLEGYGKELISGLKKISKENFGNMAPNKLLVLLKYNHPTLSDRISAIEKELK